MMEHMVLLTVYAVIHYTHVGMYICYITTYAPHPATCPLRVSRWYNYSDMMLEFSNMMFIFGVGVMEPSIS